MCVFCYNIDVLIKETIPCCRWRGLGGNSHSLPSSISLFPLSFTVIFHLSIILFLQILISWSVISSLFLNGGCHISKRHVVFPPKQFCVTVNYGKSIIFRLMNSAWCGARAVVWLASWEIVMKRRRSQLNNAWCQWPFIYISDYMSALLKFHD